MGIIIMGIIIFGLAVAGIAFYRAGCTNFTLMSAFSILFLTNHWILALILLLIVAMKAWSEYGHFFSGSIKPCPGCADCDPQAFIGDDGEVHPGL